MLHAEFNDPRLVEVYDAECPWGPDDDFFLGAVNEVPGSRVLDLGCGTGRLTIAVAAAGHTVTGVDPARASLDAARRKPGADRVTWVEGSTEVLPDAAFDTAVMTSHVAQFFVTDEEWAAALADLARAVVPGGRLIFDTRDPADRAWERWNPVDHLREVPVRAGVVTIRTEVTEVTAEGRVTFTRHSTFPDGTELDSEATLRWRPEHLVRSTLAEVGFDVEHVYGGWHREPVGSGAGEFVVVARRRG